MWLPSKHYNVIMTVTDGEERKEKKCKDVKAFAPEECEIGT